MKNIFLFLVCFINLADCTSDTTPKDPVDNPIENNLSDDATLKGITISKGELSPVFSSNITEYTVQVENSVTNITVMGEANHAEATVTGNVMYQSLDVGANTVTITVTAKDGITVKNYQVTVIRSEETEGTEETKWEIKNGKFYLNGKHEFLKIGKPLLNFADVGSVDMLIAYLETYRQKNYNALEMNCYWHHFDTNGDGEIDVSLAPLNKLIDAIYAKGMYPCLSVETYAVGGGTIPEGFWTRYPDADAINSNGNPVTDTEYGFGSRVVSLFHPGYLETARKYIRNLARGIDTQKILWFETSVEPQYMGTINLCYSDAAKQEYEKWRTANHITDEASKMPPSFPISQSFIRNETWNKFRAQWLAGWVNGDAAAYRDVAGQNAYVAVDYLDAAESDQLRRTGDPVEFLSHLTGADVIQVNWSWYFPTNTPNQKAYDRVREAMAKNGKNWAITEHMTFNGSDFVRYNNETLERILENTLTNGTRLGWEFTNILPNSADNFCLYNNDFSGKNVINVVDNQWEYWLNRVEEIENK